MHAHDELELYFAEVGGDVTVGQRRAECRRMGAVASDRRPDAQALRPRAVDPRGPTGRKRQRICPLRSPQPARDCCVMFESDAGERAIDQRLGFDQARAIGAEPVGELFGGHRHAPSGPGGS